MREVYHVAAFQSYSKVKIMKLILTGICLFLLPTWVLAQTSVSELVPSHAAALQEFLSQNPDLEFLPETSMDKDTLKDMRKNFERRMMPYHRKGDFNHDGRQDFGIILIKEGGPVNINEGVDYPYKEEFEINIVVFNGQRKGGYKAVFRKKMEAPLVCFLYSTFDKKKELYFAVYATDAGFVMTPAGKGYIAEYVD